MLPPRDLFLNYWLSEYGDESSATSRNVTQPFRAKRGHVRYEIRLRAFLEQLVVLSSKRKRFKRDKNRVSPRQPNLVRTISCSA